MPAHRAASLSCPSAQPDMADARVLGVVRRTPQGPRVSYVAGLAPVTPEVLEAAAPAPPTLVLRVAARCETSACRHFDGAACTLATRILETLPAVTPKLPPCAVRRTCRWYAEQGGDICLRCPQVVTQSDRTQVDPRLMEGAPRGGAGADP